MHQIKVEEMSIVANSDLHNYLKMLKGVTTVDEVWVDGTTYDIFLFGFGEEGWSDFSFDKLTGKLVGVSLGQ